MSEAFDSSLLHRVHIFKLYQLRDFHFEKNIIQTCTNEITLDDFSLLCSCSKTQLNRIFQAYLGDTPIKYMYRQKLKHSMILLESNMTILEIVLELGFQSHEAFTRAFKKEYGLTPKEIRHVFQNGLKSMETLNDLEQILLFSTPSKDTYENATAYRTAYQSLVNKGYLAEQEQGYVCTIEGKQITDKYFWDCSNVIIRLSKEFQTLSALYDHTIKIIRMPKILFYKFTYDLIQKMISA